LRAKAWPIPPRFHDLRYPSIVHGVGLHGEKPITAHPAELDTYTGDGVLEPGMVISIESCIGKPQGPEGVKLENQYLVTDSVHRPLTFNTRKASSPMLDIDMNAHYLQRQARLDSVMDKAGIAAIFTPDPINMHYATGTSTSTSNMTIWSLLGASRFLLHFSRGSTFLYEFSLGERLSAHLPTIPEIRPSMTSGGITAKKTFDYLITASGSERLSTCPYADALRCAGQCWPFDPSPASVRSR